VPAGSEWEEFGAEGASLEGHESNTMKKGKGLLYKGHNGSAHCSAAFKKNMKGRLIGKKLPSC